jgi:DNA-binding CsgD family transcriptional regulator
VADALPALGDGGFGPALLESLKGALPVSSMSVYRIGARPAICFSASVGVPDTTRECWNAYASGPIYKDRTLLAGDAFAGRPEPIRLCHITAMEMPAEHRAKVYEAHGVAERISVVCEESDDALFAVNLYRHAHARALTDAQLAEFGNLGPVLMALARRHVALVPPVRGFASRLATMQPDLTSRELDVCARLLRGMTQEGVAADLGLSVPTVKTYRNRAFVRMGIHFRSELFAMMLEPDVKTLSN